MRKYPKISKPSDTDGLFVGDVIHVQEKVDGANGRFTLEKNIDQEYSTPDRDIVFGSRKIQFKNKNDESNHFEDVISYIRETVDKDVLQSYDDQHGGLTLFGECMIPHTIRDGYNWDEWRNKFIGFDIWSDEYQSFLSLETCRQIYNDIGIPFINVIDTYSVSEWRSGNTVFHGEDGSWPDDNSWCPETAFGSGQAEGIIIKNPETDVYSKIVRSDFRETAQDAAQETASFNMNDAHDLSYKYITDARIEKTAYKLVDEGEWDELTMRMMKDLPKAVIQDMVEEEGYNIFINEDWEIDLGEFRSITSDRCSSVLKSLINNTP